MMPGPDPQGGPGPVVPMHHAIKQPSRIGPYVALEPISTSATSWVAKGCHGQTGRVAAIKLAGNDPDDRARLRHEARVLSIFATAPHGGVIELFETGVDDGVTWLASRFIDGPDLSSLKLAERAKPAEHLTAATRLGLCIADALAHAHDQGVVHGDLSPRNILLDKEANPVLIDFGAAVVTFDGSALREIVQPGQLFRGTPGYASPEQILGMPADSRSDLYALGCILYELLSGVPPFVADDVEALCQQHLLLSPTAPSSKLPGLPTDLDQIILALLKKDPKARLSRAQEVVDILARHSASDTPGPNRAKIRPLSMHRPHLVGRENVISSLIAHLNETAQGKGGFILVSGTSGIGKTRVLNELAHRAPGFRVMYGRCGEVSRGRSGEALSAGRALEPFSPFLEWLAHAATDTINLAEYATALAVLAPYEPTLGAALPASSIPQLSPELGRSRVLRSLLDVLLATATDRPLLLVIDDLQWADDLSRSFLQEEYRSALESSKVLIVAAHRSEDAESLSLDGHLRRVQLDPLGWDELGAMAGDMLGAQLVPTGLAEVLHRHSEGNPFFAAEYMRAFIECGLLRHTSGKGWELSEHSSTKAVSVPGSLRDLFALRLKGLSTTAKEVLEISALLGRQFRGELLEVILDSTAHRVSARDALDELVSQHILMPCGVDQYRFVHDKLREAQSQAIPNGRRQAIHRSIAALLEAPSGAERFDVPAAALGLHWAEAGEPAKAIAHLKLAAEQAAAQYMNADAAELYEMALSQIESATARSVKGEVDWRAQAICIGEARGDLLGWGARHDEARKQHDASLKLTEHHDRVIRARLERKKARAYWTLHDYDSAMAALTHAETVLGPVEHVSKADEIHEWIEIQQGFFWLHYFARRSESSTEHTMRKMADVVELHGTPIQKSMFYVCASSDVMVRQRYTYSELAVEFARRANTELRSVPDEVARAAEARFVLGFALLQGTVAQCHEAVELLEENLQALAPIGEATLLTRSLVYQAIAWRRSRDTESTLSVAARARRSSERVRLPTYIGASIACEAWVRWKRGDMFTAQRLAEEARTWWAKIPHSFPFYWLANLVLLDVHYLNDDFANALHVLTELLDPRQQGMQTDVHESLLACTEILRTSAEPRRASLAISQLLKLAHQHSYL
jgi:eukaryotic-like serine/threonine-protein kinase